MRNSPSNKTALLRVDQMHAADQFAIDSGISGIELMENAGAAVCREICQRWQARDILVLCGPGNNGGDGFVIARLLADKGWAVTIGLQGSPENLKGDAKVNADRWTGQIEPLSPSLMDGGPLVVDALFGAGLNREPEGAALDCIERINGKKLDCVAVDVPSGMDGDTGRILGAAPRCGLCVTFFRAKPGHYLFPGREYRGELIVADIGIPDDVFQNLFPTVHLNTADIWIDHFPWPASTSHKYTRGHAVVRGGGEMTGAALLAAMAARRMGAGLVTIASPESISDIYRLGSPGTLVEAADDPQELSDLLQDPRKNAILIGPGLGLDDATAPQVDCVLGTKRPAVLDADALTAYRHDPDHLLNQLTDHHVLTPHEGEFSRLFPMDGSKITRCSEASRQSGANILLKGPDTVISNPSGRSVINASGTPFLATAGSGDVLSGMIAGLLAQGLDPYLAACAGAWIHGKAGERLGPGLVAEDLIDTLPEILADLQDQSPRNIWHNVNTRRA